MQLIRQYTDPASAGFLLVGKQARVPRFRQVKAAGPSLGLRPGNVV